MSRNSSRAAAPEDTRLRRLSNRCALPETARREAAEMRAGHRRDSTHHSKINTWLENMVGGDPRVMTQLPSIYLKCTSMIMDTVNFSIDYSAPLTYEFLHGPCNPSIIQRALWERSPSQQTITGDKVSPSGCDSNKILHQKLNTRSNVKVTLQYLGTGFSVTNEIINPKDELSMFQQICGGESICVFKGYLSPGDTFQIISRRHYGYPFSASIYINGLIAARISWCCEYRHHAGFQQGRRGCLRITQLSGGKPCYRCVASHKNYQMRPGRKQSSGSTCEASITSKETDTADHMEEAKGKMGTNTWEPHNFYPTPPTTQSTAPVRRRRRKKKLPIKEGSDSEQENKAQDGNQRSRKPRRGRGSRTSCKTLSFKDDKSEAASGDCGEKIRTPGTTRTNGDHRATSTAKDNSGHRRMEEEPKDAGRTIHRRLETAMSEWSAHSEVELSDSSESSDNRCSVVTALEQQGAAQSPDQASDVTADDEGLVCQITDLIAVLQECDEVDQLVLRNTGMTDTLLHCLAPAISASKSEVESINLNLNEIGPEGAKTIIRLLRDKPCVRSLLLYGNQLGAAGIGAIMAGLSDLWLPAAGARSVSSLNVSGSQLSELDIGGNKMDSDGLRSVAAFLKLNPPLRQLCLAQSSVADMDAWAELFEVIKVNTNLTHLLLDENSLGDPGAKLVSAVIQTNHSLMSLDLDSNDIGEEGGRAIMGGLSSSGGTALINISLENNPISAETINAIDRALMTRASSTQAV